MSTVKITWAALAAVALSSCACPGAAPGVGEAPGPGETGSSSSVPAASSSSTGLATSAASGAGNSSSVGALSASGQGPSSAASNGGLPPWWPPLEPPASREQVPDGTSRALPGVQPAVEPPAHVYAHTPTGLYLLDAETLDLRLLGRLRFVDEAGEDIPGASLTDLAVTAEGFLFGSGLMAIYFIQRDTLTARRLSTVNIELTGLTFVPAGVVDPVQEALLAATRDTGELVRVDPQTGATTVLGAHGNGWLTSGDLVGIRGGLYGTVRKSNSVHDVLAHVDANTGAVTPIGTGLGRGRVWGLGYWAGTLYGFTDAGEVLRIDRMTGRAEVLRTLPVRFWGAAVTTRAAPAF